MSSFNIFKTINIGFTPIGMLNLIISLPVSLILSQVPRRNKKKDPRFRGGPLQ